MIDPADLIADKLVETLNAGSFSLAFRATAPDDPGRELNIDGTQEMPPGLQVFVVPVTETEERADGSAVNERITVNVFVSRLLDSKHTRRSLGGFVRELREALRIVELAIVDFGIWEWDSGETVTKYDSEQLTTNKRFLSVFSETYFNVL